MILSKKNVFYQNGSIKMNENKLEIRELTQIFNHKIVLDAINFEVKEGEFLSILGPSGCGKTTILRILIGLQNPTGGKILKEGKEITKLPSSKRGMGIVFQNYALFQNMTVLENVEYALKLNKEKKAEAHETALRVIEQVGLIEFQNKKPHKLSGGQQQRVAIARTLALNPEIILFDEPMSALDADNRMTLRKEIKEIQKIYHSTMIYITHDQEEAFALSDRIMVMNKGIIHQCDTPENLVKNPADAYVQSFVIDNLKQKVNALKILLEIEA